MSSLQTATPPTDDAPVSLLARPRATLIIASLATLLAIMNYTAPLTTAPDISATLHASNNALTWILNGVPLGLAALSLVAGSIADNYGRKRVFVGGLSVLAAAMVAGGLATSSVVFVAARIVQGAASATLLASSLGLIAHLYPTGVLRARATGLWGAMISAGIALGPVASGFPTPWDWRTVYCAFAAVAVVLAVMSGPLIPESKSPVRRRLDVPGVMMLGLGLAALFAGLTLGRDSWSRTDVLLLLSTAVALLAIFVAVEKRRSAPMLDLGLFRQRTFLAATVGALCTGISVLGFYSYLPTVIQQGLGVSPMTTAGVFAAWSGTSFLVAIQAERLTRWASSQTLIAVGLAICAAGTVSMLGFMSAGSWSRMLPGMFLGGLGFGLVNAMLPKLAVASVPAHDAAMGSGANSSARYIGAAVGVTVAMTVLSAGGSDIGHATDVMLGVSAALTLLGAAVIAALRKRAT